MRVVKKKDKSSKSLVTRTPSDRFSLRLNLAEKMLLRLAMHSYWMAIGQPIKNAEDIFREMIRCVVVSIVDRENFRDAKKKIILSEVEALALVYVLVPCPEPFLIELKAALLKAL